MNENEREIELYDFIEVILKYKWVILASTLLCGGAAWILQPVPAPLYEADVVLMIKRLQIDSSPESSSGVQSSGFYETLARDDGLKQALLDSLGLEMSLAAMDGLLEVKILDPGVKMTVRTADPDFSLRLVNTWARLFVARNSDLNSEEGGLYYEYVERQYRTVRGRLDSNETALHEFERDNNIGFLQIQQTTVDSSAIGLYNDIVQLERTLLDTSLVIRATDIQFRGMLTDYNSSYMQAFEKLQELDNTTPLERFHNAFVEVIARFDEGTRFDYWADLYVPAEIPILEREIAKIPHSLGNAPNSTYVKLAVRLTRLRTEYGPPLTDESEAHVAPADMPGLREIYTALSQQRHRLKVALGLIVQRWVNKVQRRSLEELQHSIGDSLAVIMRDHQRLKRNQEVLSTALDRLSTLVEEARVSRAKSANDIRILTQALEARQIGQDSNRKTGVAAGAGLLFSVFLSLLIEYVRKARALRAGDSRP
jgi:hypothetical protein